jgi:hypothetical protein
MDMPIEIDIADISHFAQVAVIVDKPKVREGIVKLRDQWSKGMVYPSMKAWRATGVKINFHQDILEMLHDAGVSPVYLYVIEEAIATNKVTKLTRVVRLPIPREVLAEYMTLINETLGKNDYEYVLITPSESERNEVEEAYAEMKRVVKETSKIDNPFEHLLQPLLQNPKTNFRNTRQWYWMYQEEKSRGRGIYKRILNSWNNQVNEGLYISEQNVIEQAVLRYRKLIKR